MTKGSRSWGFWFLGLALLVSSVGGAVWVVHTRAGDDPPGLPDLPLPTMSKPQVQADGAICRGQVGVEGKILELTPQIPGQIVDIPVTENQVVKEGTVLLRLDDRLAQNAVREAEAGLKAAQADLEIAKKLPEQQEILIAGQQKKIDQMAEAMYGAQARVDRLEALSRDKLSNASEIDIAKHVFKEAEAGWKGEQERLREIKLRTPANEIQKATANLMARDAALEKAHLALDLCTLKAPMDGMILRILAGKGEMYSPPVRQAAIQLCPNKPRIVRAEVEQEYARRVKEGMKVVVQDDVSVAGTWHGTVRSVGDWYGPKRNPELLSFNDLRTIECVIDLDPGQAPLKIGQQVRVIIGAVPEH